MLNSLPIKLILFILDTLEDLHVQHHGPPFALGHFAYWSQRANREAKGVKCSKKDLFALLLTCKKLSTIVLPRVYEAICTWRYTGDWFVTLSHLELIENVAYARYPLKACFELPSCQSMLIQPGGDRDDRVPLVLDNGTVSSYESPIRHLQISDDEDYFRFDERATLLSLPKALETLHLDVCHHMNICEDLDTAAESLVKCLTTQKTSLKTLVLTRADGYWMAPPLNLAPLAVLKHLCIFQIDLLFWKENYLDEIKFEKVLPASLKSPAIYFEYLYLDQVAGFEPDELAGYPFVVFDDADPAVENFGEWLEGWPSWLKGVLDGKAP